VTIGGEERRRPVYREAKGAFAWSVALEDGEVVERALPTRML
jgi:hypothetical protein